VRDVTFHPLCTLFPLVEGSDFEDLVEDIREHGLREPIWTLGDSGVVLDGRNRYRACVEAGVEPLFRAWHGAEDEAVLFVLSQNLHRRHLSTGQRAILAARVMPLLRELAAKRQVETRSKPGEKAGTPRARTNLSSPSPPAPKPDGRATAAAGKLTGISADTARKGAKVTERGTPQLVEAVQGGTVSVHRAAQLADLPPEEQARAVQEAQSAPRALAHDPKKTWVQLERTVAKLRRQARLCGLSPLEALERFPEKPDSRRAKKKKPAA
jgi:predicted HTH domain antitoxin